MVRTCAGRKPGSTAWTCWKLRESRAAVMIRTVDSATSAKTSVARRRLPPALEPRSPRWSASRSGARDDCSAGTMPKRRLVASDTSSVNTATRRSMAISATRGKAVGPIARSASTSTRATSRPSAPPMTPSIVASPSSCATSRGREAPSAARTASSRRRAVPRTRNRLAMFAHATSRTRTTAPRSIHNIGADRPLTSSCSGTTRTDVSAPCESGYSLRSRRPMAVRSSAACATVTSGLRRAITRRKPCARLARRASVAGE